ncbi:MAG: hypothetical protein FJ006_11410 [Chloroflexi bacterium]|nr:hypothetical protein [Chloroflexota bacterium]
MKRNRYILYAVLVAGIALLLAGLALALVPKGLIRIEERKPVDPYDAMKSYIKEARGIALELKDFTWDDFAVIGLEAPPSEVCKLGDRVTTKESFDESSGCKWFPLPEMLPRPESAGPLVFYCDTCLKMAERIRLERPSNDSTMLQWLELCSQLQSTLNGAGHLATNYKNTNEYVLTNIGNSIDNSDPGIKQRYLEKFKNKSAKYLSLLEDLANNLEQAEQALLQLTNGKLAGETTPEESAE